MKILKRLHEGLHTFSIAFRSTLILFATQLSLKYSTANQQSYREILKLLNNSI